ncbi:MAG: sigma 54-interacting transcriptional regulator [Myxococcales bacterium]
MSTEPTSELPEDLESLISSADFPVVVFDADCRYTFVNAAGARVSRMSCDEHLGRSIEDVAPDVAKFTREVVNKVLAGGRMETVAMEHGNSTGFVVSYFPFRSRIDDAPRVGVVCLPSRVLEDTPSDTWRAKLAFESLVARTASGLFRASSEEFHDQLAASLREICDSQLFPGALVLRFGREFPATSVTHSWFREVPPVDLVERIARALDARLGQLSTAPGASHYVSVGELPTTLGGLREGSCLPAGVAGVSLFPFAFDGEPAGAVMFLVSAPFSDADHSLRRLRTLSDLLASAILRDQKQRALALSLERTSRQTQVVTIERDYLREEMERALGDTTIIHRSPGMRRVLELARTVASTPATVLIRGESGVGKELVARFIHQMSPRQDAALVKVNCASIPRELFESEFFGHTRGAFTGALRDRVGRFELAHGGTIFLDEIGEIPAAEQAKLLRVIQEGEFERVGEDRTRRVDVRIVAATNRRLELDVEEGRFRRDLYFRLNVFPIEVPPLRERIEDVVPLAEYFVASYAMRFARRGLVLSTADRERLTSYHWPGNVRELANVMERSVILSTDDRLQVLIPQAHPAPSLPPASMAETPESAVVRPTTIASLRELEIEMIRAALEESAGRVSGKDGAAERLGLSPSTLRDRIKALGLR